MGSTTTSTVKSQNGFALDGADQRWGNNGIRIYLGRVMFRRVLCNLYHWGLIIGSYKGK